MKQTKQNQSVGRRKWTNEKYEHGMADSLNVGDEVIVGMWLYTVQAVKVNRATVTVEAGGTTLFNRVPRTTDVPRIVAVMDLDGGVL